MKFEREKNHRYLWRSTYAINRFFVTILGDRITLVLYLNFLWILRRLAFENAGKIYGEKFYNNALALDEDFLSRHIMKDEDVIDIGCGDGRWARSASNYARRVVAIDYDENSIQRAKSIKSKAEFYLANVNQELEKFGQFDLAMLIHVLEHIQVPDELLTKLRKITRKLIVEVPDLEADPLNFLRTSLGLPVYSDADHTAEYTEQELTTELQNNGWRIDKIVKKGGAILILASSIA